MAKKRAKKNAAKKSVGWVPLLESVCHPAEILRPPVRNIGLAARFLFSHIVSSLVVQTHREKLRTCWPRCFFRIAQRLGNMKNFCVWKAGPQTLAEVLKTIRGLL